MRLLPALLLLVLLAWSPSALARCPDRGVMLYPGPGSVIPTNTRLVLEGIGPDAARVRALAGQELTFKADDDTVTVRVLPGWTSQKDRAAVVLRPRALLRANKTYRLLLEQKLPGARLVSGGKRLTWHTGKGSDDTPPAWLDPPSVSEGLHRVEKAGVVRQVKLRVAVKEESPAYLVFRMRRSRGPSNWQTYFAPIHGREAQFGHDACTGGFDLEDGKAYQATIEVHDSAGNIGTGTRRVEFLAPRPPLRR